MIKWGICLSALLFLLLSFTGCGRAEHNLVTEEGTYKIYYLNSTRTRLASMDYETQTKDQEQLIGELAGLLLEAPENLDYQAVLADKVLLLDISKEENILYLNFNQDYNSMRPGREILCRAAMAKTLTQVEGIDYISVSCGGQPLLDSSGNPVGAFSGTDFVESVSDINSFEKVELKLYFANETRDGLAGETREVFHNINTSIERLVVEQLIAGSQNGNHSVLPRDTRIMNVSLTDTICYVNLDSGFLTGEVDAADYIPIYALVNSLTELQTVNRVQITVNGSANVIYRNSISLATPLERDERYIDGQ